MTRPIHRPYASRTLKANLKPGAVSGFCPYWYEGPEMRSDSSGSLRYRWGDECAG